MRRLLFHTLIRAQISLSVCALLGAACDDGKQELVRIARSLCDDIVRGVRVPGDATLAYVDANVWTSKAAAPDPDLILNTSSLNGTTSFQLTKACSRTRTP